MKRTITVKGRTGLFDTPSFLLAENEALTVLFSFPEEIRAGRYCVVVSHGDAPKKTFILSSDKSVTLSAEWLNEGGTEDICFSLCLQNMTGSAVIKDDYAIEPLKVETVGGNFTVTPIIREMQAEIEELKRLYAEETAAKKEILDRLNDYLDNGVELFPEGTKETEEIE